MTAKEAAWGGPFLFLHEFVLILGYIFIFIFPIPVPQLEFVRCVIFHPVFSADTEPTSW